MKEVEKAGNLVKIARFDMFPSLSILKLTNKS